MKSLTYTMIFLLLMVEICFAQWVQTNGPNNGIVKALVTSGNYLFAGTSEGGVFRSTNNGTSWIAINNGLTNLSVRSLAFSGSDFFAGTWGGGIFHSINNGTNWTAINVGLTNLNVNAFAFLGNNIFAGTWDGVFISSNNGSNWTAVNNGLTQPGIYALIVSGTNLFAATDGSGVFLSTNNGASWTEVNNGLTCPFVYALAVLGTNLFAGTTVSLFLSTNSGTSWTEIVAGLPNFGGVFSFAISGTNIFCGTGWEGVFISTSNSTCWTAVNSGLTNAYISSLVILGDTLFAGTFDSGIWSRPLSEMITDVEDNEQLPSEYLLSQNYPNPFNPTTKIKYSIPQTSQVQIKVFNVLGTEIETLVNEEKPAGTYELTWNATNLPSSIYLSQLKAGNFIQTRKMILMK